MLPADPLIEQDNAARLASWHRQQVQALIDLGDNPLDAERFVTQAEALGGPDAEHFDMQQVQALSEITPEDIADARADWYANRAVPPAFKRLLDAKERTAEMAEGGPGSGNWGHVGVPGEHGGSMPTVGPTARSEAGGYGPTMSAKRGRFAQDRAEKRREHGEIAKNLEDAPDVVTAFYSGRAAGTAKGKAGIIIDREQYASMDDEGRIFLVAHEIAHNTVEDVLTAAGGQTRDNFMKQLETGTIAAGIMKGNPYYAGGNTVPMEAVSDALGMAIGDLPAQPGTHRDRIQAKHIEVAKEIIKWSGYDLSRLQAVAARERAKLDGQLEGRR